MAVPGVANVVIWGDRFKQLQVRTDPAKLAANHLSLDEVQQVTSDALDYGLLRYTGAAKTRVGGFVDTPNQRLDVQHVGKVLTHRFLLKEVWGPGDVHETHYLRVFMTSLRRKIEADPAQPRHLLTEQGVGYRLAVD